MDREYVLVADADRATERRVRRDLAASPVDVVVAQDGLTAHETLARRGAPAMLVADLALPRRDGFALLRGLRKIDTPRQVPAVLLSAFPRIREAAQALGRELGPLVVHTHPLPEGVVATVLREADARKHGRADSIPGRSLGAPPLGGRVPDLLRASRISDLGIVNDAPPSAELTAILEKVARDFGVPVALVSIVLEDKQWFSAHVGLKGELLAKRSTPIDWAFCRHVVEGHRPLVVPDARTHPVFETNPLVREGTVTGYAGAPLMTSTGDVLGTLCIIDQKPLDVDGDDVRRLVDVARRVAGEIELHALKKRLERRGIAPVPASIPPVDTPSAPITGAMIASFDAVFRALDVGIILMTADRRVVLANDAAGALFGMDAAAFLGKTRDELVATVAPCFADADLQLERLRAPASGPFVVREDIEVAHPQPRALRWVGRPILLPRGPGHLVSLTDVTAEHALLRAEEKLAREDALTGAANRRGGDEAIEREMQRARRYPAPLSILLVDLDHFKDVNDIDGHAHGDALLKAVVLAIQGSVRAIDVVARWGGDELLVIIPGTNIEGAKALGERLRREIERVGQSLASRSRAQKRVTASIGVAELLPEEDAQHLVARADARLYAAKAGGRNQVSA